MSNEFNKAINPKVANSPAIELMPTRASQIKTVRPMPKSGGIGGATNVHTGLVYIPTGNTAEQRTIRFHEALHAAHTQRKQPIKDLMDQALEDARLHRHCSKSATSEFKQARRDELCTALLDLRKALRTPVVNPTTSLVALRAMAILQAGSVATSHNNLLNRVLSRFGDTTRKDFRKALDLLTNIENWDKARLAVTKYFGAGFASAKLPMAVVVPTTDKPEDKGKPRSPETPILDAEIVDEDGPESDGDGESDGESDDTDSGDDDGDGDGESESSSDDTGSPKRFEPSTGSELAIAPIKTETAPTKYKPVHEDAYTADLTPACDKDTYKDLSSRCPLELRIKRLDMGINRVKLSMGRKAPLPVTSGRQILARKLSGAMINPTMRVFARSVAQGGYGTILIDASGSMSIPEETLKAFLKNAPALTLGFYNAPSDQYSNHQHGNLFIYAANGYRANFEVEDIYTCADGCYGSGNLIDYQAIAWLIKQPAPHYLITDRGFTGPWGPYAKLLACKLETTGDLIVVRTLDEMKRILEEKRKKHVY